MINRDNYLLMRAFLVHLENVEQLDAGSISMYWQGLKHLLQWLDNRSVKDAPKVMPAFPEYLLTARNKRHDSEADTHQLSPKYMQKILLETKSFFRWLRQNQIGYQIITEAWIDTLKVRRSAGSQSRLQERHYWKLEDIRKITALDPASLAERRDIAAFAFLMLSGMRIGAFVTLPIYCVDIVTRKIKQLPEMGVQTKNSKAAVTFLLPISDLLSIVSEWDNYLRGLGLDLSNLLWYPRLGSKGAWSGAVVSAGLVQNKYTGRSNAFVKGLKNLCERAGVEYKSPHKIRHGFGVYGVKKSKDMAQLKAISQNLMHANIGITDGIYGRLAEDDLADIMSNFGAD